MTYDVVALLERMPSDEDVLASLAASGTEHRVRAVSGGMVIQLCDENEVPLVSIDTPMYIQVPGEPMRQFGAAYADVPTPTWWVEIRAATHDAGSRLAWRYAEQLVERAGGRIWAPPPAAATRNGAEHA
ncbi:hypothetical protein [Kribbella pratensis]|uniref:hypothetical protein n=1 Tax=Kribbella pratensis TaxID=2512112 RepID=UPI0010654A5C|nr:hypothetical protein [Kribbella pratensis]